MMNKNNDEEYERRLAEIDKKLEEPKLMKRVDDFLNELSDILGCTVELDFDVYPEADDYEDYIDSEDFSLPQESEDSKPMTLGKFVDHLSGEDRHFKVYIDDLHMKHGVNELNNVLMTTVNDAVIIVPITKSKN